MVGKQRRTVKKLHKRRNILKGYSKKKPHYIQKKSRRKKTSYKRRRSNKRTRGKRRKFILSGGMRGDGEVFGHALELFAQGAPNPQYPEAFRRARQRQWADQYTDGSMRPFSEAAVAAAAAAKPGDKVQRLLSDGRGRMAVRARDDRWRRAEEMHAANSAVAGVEEGVVDVQPGVARSLSPDNRRRSLMKDLEEEEDGGCVEEWCGGLRRLFSPQPTKQV
jgi:hypothetical protein